MRTIRTERRGFVRARNAANLRRMEVAGSVDENIDNWAEASGAIAGSDAPIFAASCFKRFLLRCGSSRWMDCVSIDSALASFDGSPAASIFVEVTPPVVPLAAEREGNDPCLADRSLNVRFAEKYAL